MESKDKSSRSGSKTNLNESTLPLLDETVDQEISKRETLEKEKIELEVCGEEEKFNTGKEKEDSTEKVEGEEQKKDKKKKKAKPATTHKRALSCGQDLSVGVNLLDRDERHINDHINLVFEDVLAEPDATHGFDGVWRVANLTFFYTRHWLYRVLSALVALPCGLIWGILFALLSLINIWLITPVLRTLEVFLAIVKRVWSGVIRTALDPLFQSCGLCLGNISTTVTSTRQEIP
ncbi:caveolin-1-like [Limulus polyphemus]|uniref:Caveolin n=1 Tax=Limulus polyphemus TaxID=6850 RepID=A0ABM1BR10_LIMPO|nr:caveolin-1-like [Limulus polyphemus]